MINHMPLKGVSIAVAFMIGNAVHAQDVEQDNKRVEALENQLQERDKLLFELLDRIEALENRFGVRHSGRQTAEPSIPETIEITKPRAAEPGTVVVDASMVERALERSLSREGALLLSKGVFEIEPALFLARQEINSATFISTEEGLTVGDNKLTINRSNADLSMRLGLPGGAQLELGLPYSRATFETVIENSFTPVSADSVTANGIGDLRVGFAKTLLREGVARPDLIGRLTWNSRTGETGPNGISLGSGFNEVRGSLTAIKRQDPIVFIGDLSYQHTFKHGDVKPGSLYGVNLGAAYALSPETSLRFGFSALYQNKVRQSGAFLEGSDRFRSSFIFGGSTLLKPGLLMNMSLGIGLTEDTDDVSLFLSFPVRFRSPIF